MKDSEYKKSVPERTFGIIRRIIQYFFIFLVVGTYILLIFRMCTKGDPSAMKKYMWTAEAVNAYNDDAGSFVVNELEAINTADLDNIFYIRNVRYTECIDQFQFTLRFNRSVLRDLAEKYGDDSVWDMPFLFTVTDDLGNVYTSYHYISGKRFVNRFYRVEFSGISLEGVSKLQVNVYYANSEVHGNKVCDTLTLYEEGRRFFDYKINGEMFIMNSPSSGMNDGTVVDPAVYAPAPMPAKPSEDTASASDASDTAG